MEIYLQRKPSKKSVDRNCRFVDIGLTIKLSQNKCKMCRFCLELSQVPSGMFNRLSECLSLGYLD